MSRRENQKGIALLLTLVVIGLLAASTIAFVRATSLEATVSDNIYAYTQAEIMAQSAIQGGMVILAQDDNDYDALTEPWAQFPQYAVAASGLFDEGGFTGTIEDLASRFNPNFLVDTQGLYEPKRLEQLERLFEILQIGPPPLDAILDWLDTDTVARPYGAEDDYYTSLPDPYPACNGRLNNPGQLFLVRGMEPEWLNGKDKQPGLLDFLTVWSEGRINVNTADEIVLMSLDDTLTSSVAREIMAARDQEPFEKLDTLRNISGLTPQAFSRITSLVTVKSSYFLIRAEGHFRQAVARVQAVVVRTGDGVQLIYYRAY
jgi:general secretion pathway protein K